MIKLMLLVFLVLFIGSAVSDIYKWTDESGTVQYGDCPPPECKSKKIEILPGPTAEESRRAQQSAEQLIDEQKQGEATGKLSKEPIKKVVGQGWEADCFSSAEYVIGPVRANPSRPLIPRALTTGEYNNLFRMLRSLKGRLRGNIDEVECLGTEDLPHMEMKAYDVEAKASHELDDILTIESDLRGIDSRTRQSQVFWLLLKNDWLRFGDMATIKHDAPQWDVDIITVKSDMFIFMRKFRRAGHNATSLQHIELRSLHISHRSFKLREWFYIQGILVGKRDWTLNRIF